LMVLFVHSVSRTFRMHCQSGNWRESPTAKSQISIISVLLRILQWFPFCKKPISLMLPCFYVISLQTDTISPRCGWHRLNVLKAAVAVCTHLFVIGIEVLTFAINWPSTGE
jgi:hypothetical protein